MQRQCFRDRRAGNCSPSVRDIVMNDHYYPGFPDVAEPIFDAETYEKVKAEREFRATHRHGKGLQQLLGYKMIGGKYYIDPQGVAAVRLAIEMYLDYRTHSEIIDALNERGYKTLTGRDFTEVTVRAMIKNDRYYPGYSDVAEPIFDEVTHEKVKAERLYRFEHKHRKGMKRT